MFQASRRTSAVLRVVREFSSIAGTRGQPVCSASRYMRSNGWPSSAGHQPEDEQRLAAGDDRGERQQGVDAEQQARLAHDPRPGVRGDERFSRPPERVAKRGGNPLAPIGQA